MKTKEVLTPEERRLRRLAWHKEYNARRMGRLKPRELLTEEQKLERKRERDRRRAARIREKEQDALESVYRPPKIRTCRHDDCTANTTPTSYWWCSEHKAQANWGDDDQIYSIDLPTSRTAQD